MSRRKKSRRRRLLRLANLLPFLPLAGRAPMYARLLWALLTDPRVPPARKALLVVAGAYVVSPIDLIPEDLPIIGALDDVAVMVLAIDAFFDGLPQSLVVEKLDELGIAREELDSDLARVRRLVPKPVRSAVAAMPGLIESVVGYVTRQIAQAANSTEEASA
jgi:uncharacterized membrane protein YkvA (DUF1232 family)